jgi:hypothetical protein
MLPDARAQRHQMWEIAYDPARCFDANEDNGPAANFHHESPRIRFS